MAFSCYITLYEQLHIKYMSLPETYGLPTIYNLISWFGIIRLGLRDVSPEERKNNILQEKERKKRTSRHRKAEKTDYVKTRLVNVLI